MTARHFNTSCPDCNRWRCVCNDHGCPDCGEGEQPCACIRAESAEAYDAAMAVARGQCGPRAPVRTGPPPAPIRQRLEALRAEIAAHLGRRV